MTGIPTDRLHEIAAMRDEDIDTSDIPELSDTFFANAVLTRPGQRPMRLLPLKEVDQRLKALGIGHFAVDELVRAARKNRAQLAHNIHEGTPMTTIISNGNRWAGEAPATLDELIAVLKDYPLNAQYAPFHHTSGETGATRFFGNFATVSHVFNIDTTDPDTIATLKAAIASNLTRPDYHPLPTKTENDTDDEQQTKLL